MVEASAKAAGLERHVRRARLRRGAARGREGRGRAVRMQVTATRLDDRSRTRSPAGAGPPRGAPVLIPLALKRCWRHVRHFSGPAGVEPGTRGLALDARARRAWHDDHRRVPRDHRRQEPARPDHYLQRQGPGRLVAGGLVPTRSTTARRAWSAPSGPTSAWCRSTRGPPAATLRGPPPRRPLRPTTRRYRTALYVSRVGSAAYSPGARRSPCYLLALRRLATGAARCCWPPPTRSPPRRSSTAPPSRPPAVRRPAPARPRRHPPGTWRKGHGLRDRHVPQLPAVLAEYPAAVRWRCCGCSRWSAWRPQHPPPWSRSALQRPARGSSRVPHGRVRRPADTGYDFVYLAEFAEGMRVNYGIHALDPG